jgi:hypothetical protein
MSDATDQHIRDLTDKVDQVLAVVTLMRTELDLARDVVRKLDDKQPRACLEQKLVDLTNLSAQISTIWRDQATSPLADLRLKVFHVLRDLDFDPDGPRGE